MNEKVICAGFGGQGVMSLGRLISYTGMRVGMEVSWLPSYGPEMRGGTANCHVIVSDTLVGSPVISHDATAVLALNYPSMVKFEHELIEGGYMFYNSSLIEEAPGRKGITAIAVPSNEIASEVGDLRVANMVMLGAYIAVCRPFTLEDVVEALREVFGPGKEKFIPLNETALKRGIEVAEKAAVGS